MLGSVSAGEPVLPLTLLGTTDAPARRIEVETIVDTGFDGELALAPGLIRRLGYPYAGFTRGTLADGSTVRLDYHEGRVLWHGKERPVVVLAAGEAADPLVGTALLHGSRLEIDFVDGGSVVIEPLP